MSLEEFGKGVGVAISELKELKPEEILLVHHDDIVSLYRSPIAPLNWLRHSLLLAVKTSPRLKFF